MVFFIIQRKKKKNYVDYFYRNNCGMRLETFSDNFVYDINQNFVEFF